MHFLARFCLESTNGFFHPLSENLKFVVFLWLSFLSRSGFFVWLGTCSSFFFLPVMSTKPAAPVLSSYSVHCLTLQCLNNATETQCHPPRCWRGNFLFVKKVQILSNLKQPPRYDPQNDSFFREAVVICLFVKPSNAFECKLWPLSWSKSGHG